MFVKLQRVLANIPKNIKKSYFGGGIHLLFTANVWIKKSLKDEYPKYYFYIFFKTQTSQLDVNIKMESSKLSCIL